MPVSNVIPITIIIPSYGREKKLDRAVTSILTQSVLPHEIIIVDDGSPVPLKPPEVEALGCLVRIIRLPVNVGAAEARNAGLQAAQTEWVSFLDSDDWLLPDTLHIRWEFLLENETRSQTKRRTVYGCGWQDTLTDGEVLRERIPYPVAKAAEYFLGCWFSPGSCIIFNGREVLRKAGKVDGGLRRLEDYEWFIRIGLAGFSLKVQDVIGVGIERGSNTNLEIVTTASKLIRQRVWELTEFHPDRDDLRRRANAYLLFERAASAWRERRTRTFLHLMIRSWVALPRLRLSPVPGWKVRYPT